MIKDYNNPYIVGHIASSSIEAVKYLLKKYQKLNFEKFKERFKENLEIRLSQDDRTKELKDTLDYDEIAKLVYRKIAEYYIANKSFKGIGEYLRLTNFIVEGELTLRAFRSNKDIKEKLF